MNNDQQTGFALLETLIALFILTFGLLGLSALQLKTLQVSHSAYQRSVANIIANDAVERLWANLALATPANAAQIRQRWLEHWQKSDNNRLSLPGFNGTITPPANPTGAYTVSVIWTENRFGGVGQTRFDYNFMLYP